MDRPRFVLRLRRFFGYKIKSAKVRLFERRAGSVARLDECAELVVDKTNAQAFLDVFRLFGRLSRNHRHDVLAIIGTIAESLRRESL